MKSLIHDRTLRSIWSAEQGFPEHLDGVVGIAQGAWSRRRWWPQRLGLEMKIIALNYRDDANAPRYAEPSCCSPRSRLGAWQRVLLVDDVWVTGRSWHVARALLPADGEVLPFVLKGRVGLCAHPRHRRLRAVAVAGLWNATGDPDLSGPDRRH